MSCGAVCVGSGSDDSLLGRVRSGCGVRAGLNSFAGRDTVRVAVDGGWPPAAAAAAAAVHEQQGGHAADAAVPQQPAQHQPRRAHEEDKFPVFTPPQPL